MNLKKNDGIPLGLSNLNVASLSTYLKSSIAKEKDSCSTTSIPLSHEWKSRHFFTWGDVTTSL